MKCTERLTHENAALQDTNLNEDTDEQAGKAKLENGEGEDSTIAAGTGKLEVQEKEPEKIGKTASSTSSAGLEADKERLRVNAEEIQIFR